MGNILKHLFHSTDLSFIISLFFFCSLSDLSEESSFSLLSEPQYSILFMGDIVSQSCLLFGFVKGSKSKSERDFEEM